MLIFDGDYPMAYGAIDLNRDLTLPISDVRAVSDDPTNIPFASLPEMRRGRIAAALVKIAAHRLREGSVLPGLRGEAAVYGVAQGQLAYYQMLAHAQEAVILTTSTLFSEHMVRWEQATETDALPVGFVLGMEGADPILWPEQIHDWWEEGVRVVSLTHYGPSTYARGTGTPGGLLPPAADLLREMESCGMLLDLTHISDDGFWQALEIYTGPVLASHQNCRALAPGERQFSDEQLLAVIARGGVIGVSMDTWMLYPEPVLDWSNTGAFNWR
ncbi:membrane dipeptidase [Chloroflexi bacterium TSY]|nr:membrane dipeptidase [Chloroflexi bacterium TSY]